MLAKLRSIIITYSTFIKKILRQKERFFRLAREFGWIFVGQLASVLGALVLVRVLTEHLSPDEYGRLALAMTFGTLMGQVVLSFNAGVGRYFSFAWDEKDLRNFRSGVVRLCCIAGMMVTLLTLIVAILLKITGSGCWISILLLTAFFSYVAGCSSCLNSIQTAARQRASVALHSGGEAWLKIGLVLFTMTIFGSQCGPVVVGYTLASLLACLSQFYWVNRFVEKQKDCAVPSRPGFWEKRILWFSWPISFFGFFTWMQISSERWALERFSTTAEVGQYAVLYQLGYSPISIFSGLAITLLAPILYQRFNSLGDLGNQHTAHIISWNTTYLALGFTTLGFVMTMLCHKWIFQLFVAEPFQGTSFLLPWVVLAGGFFSAGQVLSLKMMAEMRTRLLLTLKIFSALLGLGANILGAWLFGISGVIMGMLVFSVVYFLWAALLTVRPCIVGNFNQSGAY